MKQGLHCGQLKPFSAPDEYSGYSNLFDITLGLFVMRGMLGGATGVRRRTLQVKSGVPQKHDRFGTRRAGFRSGLPCTCLSCTCNLWSCNFCVLLLLVFWSC